MACAPKFTPHPKSAPGDFYVVKGECLACGVPHVVAPDLVGGQARRFRTAFGRNSQKPRQNSNEPLRFWKPKNWNATDMEELTLQFLTECCPPIVTIRCPRLTYPHRPILRYHASHFFMIAPVC